MKKGILLVALLLSMSFAFAESACDLDVTLLNQDPYPAVQGEYVKLVFQLDGLESPDCGDITFTLIENYPIVFNPGETGIRTFKKVDYVKDYESTIQIPFEIRIDDDALDGENSIDVKIKNSGDATIEKSLDIEVKDARVDFEAYVTDYDYATRELTLEVLNIGDSDIEALSVEIPKQDNIKIKGSNRIVVGDLDSNEYTSADFEAVPQDGEFTINLIYSDSVNIRRTVEKTLTFDSSYFTNRVADEPQKMGAGGYIVIILILLLLVYIIYRKIKKAKAKKAKLSKK